MNSASGGANGALNEGLRLLQVGDFAGAVVQLQQANRENPQDGRVLGYLGMAFARLGDLSNSVFALQEATRLLPQDSSAHYNLAVALIQSGRQAEARSALERSLALDPNNLKAQTAIQSLGASSFASGVVSGVASGLPSSAPEIPQTTSYGAPVAGVPQPPVSGIPTVVPIAPPSIYASPPPVYGASDVSGASTPTVMSLNGEAVPNVTQLPPSYQAPPVNVGVPPYAGQPPYGGPAGVPGPGGMQYNPSLRPVASSEPPGLGKRLLRGLGWGALFGQWWTLWIIVWEFVIHGGYLQRPLALLLATIFIGIFFAIVGGVLGLIIGALDSDEDQGMYIGIGCGLLLLGLEYWLSGGSAQIALNIFFWVFTSRFVGRNISRHVQAD